ncbi:MAG: hypothetical protein QW314_07210 [Thermoproteota archaeon]|nr:hypothetical protein [Candidatus Brockarchaeota archaeon]MBO3801603.1 hypothetical protein [Candidatus Brockarchaeota archaeon]
MGGKKKPTISQAEKAIRRAQMQEAGKQAQKRKETENREKARWSITQIDLEKVKEKISSLKVVTPFELASQLSINIGEAKRVLNELSSKGELVRLSSFNGHPVYTLPKQEQVTS